MNEQKVSRNVRSFIYSYIQSVAQIEVLAFVFTHKNRAWTVQEISHELRSSDHSVERNIKLLTRLGIVMSDQSDSPRYNYAPGDPKLAATVEELISAFTIYPVRVIEIVYNRSQEVIRSFSEAFKIRKDDNEDG